MAKPPVGRLLGLLRDMRDRVNEAAPDTTAARFRIIGRTFNDLADIVHALEEELSIELPDPVRYVGDIDGLRRAIEAALDEAESSSEAESEAESEASSEAGG